MSDAEVEKTFLDTSLEHESRTVNFRNISSNIAALVSGGPVDLRQAKDLPVEAFTDQFNVRRFVEEHGPDIRYVSEWGWMVYSGDRWELDCTGEIERRMKATVQNHFQRIAFIRDENRQRDFAKFACRSQGYVPIQNAIRLAQSEIEVVARPSDFDRDKFLFNAQNGTIDVRTGELRTHRPEDFITKISPVMFDPKADCPRWKKFLDEIFQGNQTLIGFVKRIIGYALTGDTREQVLMILYGTGANGKSTLLNLLLELAGDYGIRTPTDTLMVRHGDAAIPNDVARLRGSRMAAASETEDGRRLAESRIKDMTGGETLCARYLHQEYFEFKPEFKLFLGTNHKPVIRGTDHGIWRRIRLVPFNVQIPDEQQDKNLPDKLRVELPGILGWAVEGCLEWQINGLGTPDEVRTATDAYRQDMDVLAGFLGDRCSISAEATITAGSLYQAYTAWAEKTGERVMSQRSFGLRLSEKGFQPVRTKFERAWKGLELVTQMSG